MSNIIMRAALLAALPFASQTNAQALGGFAAELNYAEVSDVQGAELGLGWRIPVGASFAVTPLVGTFIYQGEGDGRYYQDSSVDRCRDSTNGQFADDRNCDDTEFAAYGRLEATYSFDRLEVGAGYRFAEESEQPYATVAFQSQQNVGLKLNAGEDYWGVGITFHR